MFRYKEECEDACSTESVHTTTTPEPVVIKENNEVGFLNVGKGEENEREEIVEENNVDQTYGTNSPIRHTTQSYELPKTGNFLF